MNCDYTMFYPSISNIIVNEFLLLGEWLGITPKVKVKSWPLTQQGLVMSRSNCQGTFAYVHFDLFSDTLQPSHSLQQSSSCE